MPLSVFLLRVFLTGAFIFKLSFALFPCIQAYIHAYTNHIRAPYKIPPLTMCPVVLYLPAFWSTSYANLLILAAAGGGVDGWAGDVACSANEAVWDRPPGPRVHAGRVRRPGLSHWPAYRPQHGPQPMAPRAQTVRCLAMHSYIHV